MCLAHEGQPYGYLSDGVGALQEFFMASRCVVSVKAFRAYLAELLKAHRVVINDETGLMCIPRMVRDEEIRVSRAAGGVKSIGHPNTHPPKDKDGYPSIHPSIASKGDHLSHVSADAHSDSDSKFLRTSKRKQKALPADEWFECSFWPLWPVSENKQAGRVASRKLNESDRELAIAGIRRQSVRIAAMERPIHAATWLNNRRWEDQDHNPAKPAHVPLPPPKFWVDDLLDPK
tara:strand:+ start:739 stop:1434 length:696 start_codon:yes stop_codon:yes gene_type:complete